MGTTESITDLGEEQKGDIFILRIKGRLDALSSPDVEKRIFDRISGGQYKLLIDLGGVTYLSSAGLRLLLATTKRIRAFPGKVIICSMSTTVMDVLKMSGFDHVLEIFKTEEEALRHF